MGPCLRSARLGGVGVDCRLFAADGGAGSGCNWGGCGAVLLDLLDAKEAEVKLCC